MSYLRYATSAPGGAARVAVSPIIVPILAIASIVFGIREQVDLMWWAGLGVLSGYSLSGSV